MRTSAIHRSRSLGHSERSSAGAGFTLLELMVAIGILLVASMGALTSQVTSMNLIKTSRETNIAMAELQAAMERVLAEPAQQLPIHTEYGEGVSIPAFMDRHLQDENVVVTYPGYVGGDVPDPLPVQLTIRWSDFHGRPRSLLLTSMTTQ
ncbi:MAG: prepilin-type N-terminal cleavage/methylation domain-containing protein [Chlamydiales bacterium]